MYNIVHYAFCFVSTMIVVCIERYQCLNKFCLSIEGKPQLRIHFVVWLAVTLLYFIVNDFKFVLIALKDECFQKIMLLIKNVLFSIKFLFEFISV